ncbi:CtsR family transcriptional regulator [Anaerobranca gottschalkii]|uniref:Transcriptional regulator CtsR n=1 Tax=Anaerobranca gottschalkii DSM 13577 TaxID=1120990 RepID=A0A1I0B5L7_9FIRM|nr:CtsR family transcriptional regulator [Anaerobranca gottschalkii]SET02158.1 transcriptional regulator CtsR [Anaerobranca gottschalkii DSM 13577]
MSSLSNQIEKYILSLLKMSSNNQIEIKRNELAFILSCVPSQINYVLQTRFTPERGFKVESQRGGGGYIRITKITPSAKETMKYLSTILEKGISYNQCKDLVLRLQEEGIFTKREGKILIEITKAEVLGIPLPLRDKVRAEILKNALITVIE